jgi:hypothetical protein
MMRHIYLSTIASLALLPLLAAAQSSDHAMDQGNTPTEKRPWVGVSISPAPEALRHQLKLSDGVGLLVEFVQPHSPASDAGIKPFDLLLKLDDQWLINPEQFSVLIRMRHAGDEVKLSFLRQAREQGVTVKLVDHELSHPSDSNAPWAAEPAAPRIAPGEGAGSRVLTWVDGHRAVSVTRANEHTGLVVKDVDTGRVLFDGPIDTEDQRKSLPPDVHGFLDSLIKISTAFGVPLGNPDKQPPARDDAGKRP